MKPGDLVTTDDPVYGTSLARIGDLIILGRGMISIPLWGSFENNNISVPGLGAPFHRLVGSQQVARMNDRHVALIIKKCGLWVKVLTDEGKSGWTDYDRFQILGEG